MDVDEWEFLPDSGYLDFNEEGEKKIFLGKRKLESENVLDMDYFCPSPPSSTKLTEAPRSPRFHNNQLLPVPILLEPRIGKDITKNHHPMEVTTVAAPPATTEKIKAPNIGASVAPDHDTVSQVFFKIKENEFVDMKMDSPRSSSRGLLPPVDTGSLKFEDKGEAIEMITSPRMKIVEEDMLSMECDEEEDSTWEEEGNTGGFNIWKWSLTGVGAICSFGVAAATICILFFGSHKKRNKLQQDQKIRFQIYADDKRIKQVVQHATKFNEAVSSVTGVPISRAHITVGGYHDGL